MRKVIRRVIIRCWSGRRVCRMRLEVKVSLGGPRQSQRFQWLMSFSDGPQLRWRPRGEVENVSSSERPRLRRCSASSCSPSSCWADEAVSEVSSNNRSSSSSSSSACINCNLLVDEEGQTAAASAADPEARGATSMEETDEFLDGSVYSENPTSTSSTRAVDNQNQNQNEADGHQTVTDSDTDSDIAIATDNSTGSGIASFFGSNTGATIVNAANAGGSSTCCAAAKDADTNCEDNAADAGDDEAANAEQDSGVASSESAATKLAELRRFYEAELDLAVRLNRTIADPEFHAVDMRLVRRNFRLVKQRRHPTQLLMDGCRQEEMGVNRLQQLLMERRVKQCKLAMEGGTGQADSAAVQVAAAYPEWLSFQLRIKKELGDHRWVDFVRHHGRLRAAEPRNSERMANVRESQKYSQEYIDVWTNYVTVLVKSGATFSDALRTAFHKLGLEHRADFKFTIGCFLGDTRGKSSGKEPKTPVEIFEATPVLDLYRQNAGEVFVNSNKQQMYRLFPEFFDRPAVAQVAARGRQSTK